MAQKSKSKPKYLLPLCILNPDIRELTQITGEDPGLYSDDSQMPQVDRESENHSLKKETS